MVPDGWRRESLGDVLDLSSGKRPELLDDADVPVFGGNGLMGWTNEALLAEPTVVIGRVGSPGTIHKTPGPSWVSDNALYVSDLAADVDSSFMAILLEFERLEQYATRSSHPSLSQRAVFGVEVILPPLPEQQEIAAILSSVDDAMAETRRVIDQTMRVKKGLLQAMMTRGVGHTRFKKTEIGEIPEAWKLRPFASIVADRTLGTGSRGAGSGDPYSLIKMGNLQWGGLDISEVESLEASEELDDLKLQDGDFLFNTRNTPELVGKTAVWHGEAAQAVPDNNIMRIRFVTGVLPDFVCAQMAHGKGRRRLRRLAAGSTSVAAIYWKDLAKYVVAVPPMDEQRTITRLLAQVDEYVARSKATTTANRRLKRGLVQDLLTGRVRVQPD